MKTRRWKNISFTIFLHVNSTWECVEYKLMKFPCKGGFMMESSMFKRYRTDYLTLSATTRVNIHSELLCYTLLTDNQAANCIVVLYLQMLHKNATHAASSPS